MLYIVCYVHIRITHRCVYIYIYIYIYVYVYNSCYVCIYIYIYIDIQTAPIAQWLERMD